MDGDLIFAAATGKQPMESPVADTLALGHAASTTMARAIARALYHAQPAAGDTLPCWSARL